MSVLPDLPLDVCLCLYQEWHGAWSCTSCSLVPLGQSMVETIGFFPWTTGKPRENSGWNTQEEIKKCTVPWRINPSRPFQMDWDVSYSNTHDCCVCVRIYIYIYTYRKNNHRNNTDDNIHQIYLYIEIYQLYVYTCIHYDIMILHTAYEHVVLQCSARGDIKRLTAHPALWIIPGPGLLLVLLLSRLCIIRIQYYTIFIHMYIYIYICKYTYVLYTYGIYIYTYIHIHMQLKESSRPQHQHLLEALASLYVVIDMFDVLWCQPHLWDLMFQWPTAIGAVPGSS